MMEISLVENILFSIKLGMHKNLNLDRASVFIQDSCANYSTVKANQFDWNIN